MIIWILWVSLLLLIAPRLSDALPIPTFELDRLSFGHPSQLSLAPATRLETKPLDRKLEAIAALGCAGCNGATRLCNLEGRDYAHLAEHIDEPRLADLFRQLDAFEHGCTARVSRSITAAIREGVHAAASGTATGDLPGSVLRVQALGRLRQLFLDLVPDSSAAEAEGRSSPLDTAAAIRYVQQVYDTAWLFVLDASSSLWRGGAPPTPSALTVDWLALAAEQDATTVQPAASARSEWFRFATAAGLPSYAGYVVTRPKQASPQMMHSSSSGSSAGHLGAGEKETVTFDGLAAALRVVLGPRHGWTVLAGDGAVSRYFSLFEGRKSSDAVIPAEVRHATKMVVSMKADGRVDLAYAFRRVLEGAEKPRPGASEDRNRHWHAHSRPCVNTSFVRIRQFVNEVMDRTMSMWGRAEL